jgi:hypothetical protein
MEQWISCIDFPAPPNDKVQQRCRLQRRNVSKSGYAGPVCCNYWFDPAYEDITEPFAHMWKSLAQYKTK